MKHQCRLMWNTLSPSLKQRDKAEYQQKGNSMARMIKDMEKGEKEKWGLLILER